MQILVPKTQDELLIYIGSGFYCLDHLVVSFNPSGRIDINASVICYK